MSRGAASRDGTSWTLTGTRMTGVILLLIVGPLGLVIRERYREAELRKMRAAEFE